MAQGSDNDDNLVTIFCDMEGNAVTMCYDSNYNVLPVCYKDDNMIRISMILLWP